MQIWVALPRELEETEPSFTHIPTGEMPTWEREGIAMKLLIAQNSRLCTFEMSANTTVYLFGGEPLPEKRFIDWNFVSSRRERLQQAKEDWIERRFPEVPGETDFVPYPTLK